MCVSVCVCVHVCVCVSRCVYCVFVCFCRYVRPSVRVWMHANISMRACGYVCMYGYMSLCMSVWYVRVRVYVCVSVCVCVHISNCKCMFWWVFV